MLKYLVVYAILAAWIFRDAASRKTAGVKWALPAVLFAPFVLPLWLAKRPLKSGEVREGGTA